MDEDDSYFFITCTVFIKENEIEFEPWPQEKSARKKIIKALDRFKKNSKITHSYLEEEYFTFKIERGKEISAAGKTLC